MNRDLFGQVINDTPHSGPRKKPKRSNKATGYPKPPGGGPDGETCKSCKHSTATSTHGKRYWKCGLLRAHWTRGLGSDIRLKSPACVLWEEDVCDMCVQMEAIEVAQPAKVKCSECGKVHNRKVKA